MVGMHRLGLGLCCLWALPFGACVPDYRPPELGAPHAVARLRLAYHAWSGTLLEQTVMVDGSAVKDVPAPAQAAAGPATRTVLLRPGTVRWTIQSAFFHNDVSTHAESFTSTEAHSCNDTSCTEPPPQAHNVNVVTRVDDATCEAGIKHQAVAGETYTIEFDFFADRRCSLQCFRQTSRGAGKSASVACEGK